MELQKELDNKKHMVSNFLLRYTVLFFIICFLKVTSLEELVKKVTAELKEEHIQRQAAECEVCTLLGQYNVATMLVSASVLFYGGTYI